MWNTLQTSNCYPTSEHPIFPNRDLKMSFKTDAKLAAESLQRVRLLLKLSGSWTLHLSKDSDRSLGCLSAAGWLFLREESPNDLERSGISTLVSPWKRSKPQVVVSLESISWMQFSFCFFLFFIFIEYGTHSETIKILQARQIDL